MKFSTSLAVVAVLAAQGASAFAPSNTKSATTALSASRRSVLESAFSAALAVGVVALPQQASAEPRPMYLSEPTDEFKANEAKAMEFKRQQLAIKKDFVQALEQFLNEPNDEAAIVKDLNTLQGLVAKTGGLPLGIKKDELFKQIRSKKGKGFWPTNCEIAYQSLQGEIRFQQSPNLDKEMGNPFQ